MDFLVFGCDRSFLKCKGGFFIVEIGLRNIGLVVSGFGV